MRTDTERAASAANWIEEHIPLNTRLDIAREKLEALPPDRRLEAALMLTRGITGTNNMALARGVAGIRVLEALVEEWKKRAESAEDVVRAMHDVLNRAAFRQRD
jgi:hypothetical protein